MEPIVLIVSNSYDLHADIVAAKIAARGGTCFRLDLDRFPRDYGVDVRLIGRGWTGALTCRSTGLRMEPACVGAVWLRKKGEFAFAASDLERQELAFARGEAEHLAFGLLYGLDCFWMSHPRAVRGAMWKLEQLQRAARMGFAVPSSLVTDRRESVEIFMTEQGGDIVYKPLSSASLAADDVDPAEVTVGNLPTTRIGPEHGEALDAVAALPCLFQAYVPKQHELRVTVIGDRVFAAGIHSQGDYRTLTDWRDFSADIPFTAETLGPGLERRCREFVHSYGLTFGALDLIVTPDDDVVFLENNPVGQFLFVEELVPSFDLTGTVADCLLTATRERTCP